MERQELLTQIATYKQDGGGYDLYRMLQEIAGLDGLGATFAEMMWNHEDYSNADPRIALAKQINSAINDSEQAARRAETQAALTRALANEGSDADWHLLTKRGLAVAEYNDPESNAPSGAHLRGWRDIDGNIYTDQAGLEEHPGRL